MTITTSQFKPQVLEYIDEAYARCGIEARTGYQLKVAIRSLNFLFSDWANRGLNRWTIKSETQTLSEGNAAYNLTDVDNIDVLSMVIRTDDTDTSKQSDTTMTRVSRSEFLNIPNKLQKGKPNLFYIDRGTNQLVLNIWPTPDGATTYTLIFDMLHSVGEIDHTNENPDIPFRFMQCLASGLAYQLAIKFAPDRVVLLKQEYEEDFRRAYEEDRDRSPLKLVPNGAYLRV